MIVHSVTVLAPRKKPTRVPNSSQLPKKPRFLAGAYSAMNVAAPPDSPPAEKPCRPRRRRTKIAAHMPIWSQVGRSPMTNVEPDMSSTVRARIFCLPSLSPSGPSTKLPNGRMTNVTARSAKVASAPSDVLPALKNV